MWIGTTSQLCVYFTSCVGMIAVIFYQRWLEVFEMERSLFNYKDYD
jgi:hypothetical protein